MDIQCDRCKNAFNKRLQLIVCQNNSAEIYPEKIVTVCDAVYFIDLINLLKQSCRSLPSPYTSVMG